jgi:hypothetical protein
MNGYEPNLTLGFDTTIASSILRQKKKNKKEIKRVK